VGGVGGSGGECREKAEIGAGEWGCGTGWVRETRHVGTPQRGEGEGGGGGRRDLHRGFNGSGAHRRVNVLAVHVPAAERARRVSGASAARWLGKSAAGWMCVGCRT
jgi:hypothetical protein